MLEIWVLNVAHGDSILLRYRDGTKSLIGVIDSNCPIGRDPPVLHKLAQLGVDKLDFVALTHPHADHYLGLHRVLRAYEGRITTFVTCPIAGDLNVRRKKYAQLYARVASESDSEVVRARAADFVRLICTANAQERAGKLEWCEVPGPENVLTDLHSVGGPRVTVILPFKKIKGEYFQLLENGSPLVLETLKVNEISLAIRVEYAGRELVFGGDAPYLGWIAHRKHLANQSRKLRAVASKLPHHGARDDCTDDVIDYIYVEPASGAERFALISANGRSHPAPEVLRAIASRGIKPFCTNLARICGQRVRQLFTSPNVDAETKKLINSMEIDLQEAAMQPCQGDIHLVIDSSGAVSVTPQYRNACHFRGDLDQLPLL